MGEKSGVLERESSSVRFRTFLFSFFFCLEDGWQPISCAMVSTSHRQCSTTDIRGSQCRNLKQQQSVCVWKMKMHQSVRETAKRYHPNVNVRRPRHKEDQATYKRVPFWQYQDSYGRVIWRFRESSSVRFRTFLFSFFFCLEDGWQPISCAMVSTSLCVCVFQKV